MKARRLIRVPPTQDRQPQGLRIRPGKVRVMVHASMARRNAPFAAAAHPIAGAHSIWEIVLHLTSGYILVLRRVRGEGAQLSPEEEWPPVPEFSSEAWRKSQDTLDQLNQQLQSAVRAFPSERLSQELGSEYAAYTQFCGAPQHDLYHAGQIVILKKALAVSRGAA